MTPLVRMLIVAAFLALGATPALADACRGHDRSSGTILGAITGGVLGGAVSHGNGGAVIGGALLGGLAGHAVAQDMDCQDQPYAARAYDRSFRGPVGRRESWTRGANRGTIVTEREYYRGNRLCRDFTQVVYRRGREYDRPGTACRNRRGEWEFL